MQDEVNDLSEKDQAAVMQTVTHMCMDRPLTSTDASKEYVQPQYFVDCLNALFLLPTKPYKPGVVSFFLDNF